MVYSMAKLIYNQKVWILTPAVVSLLIFAISRIINEMKTVQYDYQIVYRPLCVPEKYAERDYTGMVVYFSSLFFNLSMLPFCVFQRFHV